MRPRVIVFDLADHTLWPFRVDKDSKPPFRMDESGFIIDSQGNQFNHFPGIHEVLNTLLDEEYILGVASRIENIDGAYQLLKLFNLMKYFSYIVIYPGTKINHFKDLRFHTGVDFQDMLFFDDDRRNIRDISRLGVTSVQVTNGITKDLINENISRLITKSRFGDGI